MGIKNDKGLFTKAQKVRVPRKIKKKIPTGVYCYVFTGETGQKWNDEYKTYLPTYKIRCCPMWFINSLGHGDCKALIKNGSALNGDNDDLDFCLDDQCKSCGLKKGKDYE